VKVLVDTSVWSRAFRRDGDKNHPAAMRLSRIVGKADVVLTGVILQEVLQGFRSDATFRRLARDLEPFPLLQLDRRDYVAAARLRRTCAAAGVTASTIDCQIAAAAIEHRCVLFALDRDFDRIARHSALQLLAVEA
jgi:predicted nucleic acid-binding protein